VNEGLATVGNTCQNWPITNATRLIPGADFSDHSSRWREGYQAVMITDTAFYRNANYHTMWDTAERLDYQRMKQAVEAVHTAMIDQTH